MKARIHAYDDIKRSFGDGSRGLTLEVSSPRMVVQVAEGTLTIQASESEFKGSIGDWHSTAPVKDYRRELTLQLTPEDLKRIFEAALAAGLVGLAVSTPEAPSVQN